MMKRIVSLTLVVLMIAALFVGCSSDSGSPEGTYKLKKINGKSPKDFFTEMMSEMLKAFGAEGDVLDAAMEELTGKLDQLGDLMTVELKADGTVEMKSKMDAAMSEDEESEGEVSTGTWKQDGDKITFTLTDADGKSETVEGTFKGGEITLSEGEGDEAMTMVLGK